MNTVPEPVAELQHIENIIGSHNELAKLWQICGAHILDAPVLNHLCRGSGPGNLTFEYQRPGFIDQVAVIHGTLTDTRRILVFAKCLEQRIKRTHGTDEVCIPDDTGSIRPIPVATNQYRSIHH